MKRSGTYGVVLAGATLAAALSAETPARAANPSCAALGIPGTPVYIAGSSAVKPVLKELSGTLAALASNPVRIIYQSVSSCTGLSDVATATGEKATGTYWAADGTEMQCDVDAVNGQVPDIGVSDVYPTTCDNVTLPPSGFKDFPGPVQVMTFAVPPSSKENAISAEAARVVYGFGGNGTVVAPWNDPTVVFQRPDTSGTRRMIGKAIGLDIGKWHAIEKKGSGDVLSAVHAAEATNPNAGIGILAADFADTNRTGPSAIKVLAFQPSGESCAYYPDSSGTTFDKINVREGKYPIWGPVHFVTKVDGAGAPSNALAKTVLDYIQGNGLDEATSKTIIDAEVAARTVPQCAMKVKRDGEVGTSAQTSAYQPDAPCGCYFESKATGSAPASCKTCTDDNGCGGNGAKCRYGFCEAK